MADTQGAPTLPHDFDAPTLLARIETAPEAHRAVIVALASLYSTGSYARTARRLGTSTPTLENWAKAFSRMGLAAIPLIASGQEHDHSGNVVAFRRPPAPKASSSIPSRQEGQSRQSLPNARPVDEEPTSSGEAQPRYERAENRWYPADSIEGLINRAKSPEHARSLNAIAMSYSGASVGDIAARFDVTPDIVRTWIRYFNEVSPQALAIRGRKFGTPIPGRQVHALPPGYDAASLSKFATEAHTDERRQTLLALAALYKGYTIVDACYIYGLTKPSMDAVIAAFRSHGPGVIKDDGRPVRKPNRRDPNDA